MNITQLFNAALKGEIDWEHVFEALAQDADMRHDTERADQVINQATERKDSHVE